MRPDPTIRRDVEGLLASDADASRQGFLEATVAHRPPRGQDVDALGVDAQFGRRLGPYLLRECVGAGGMGRVYKAERVEGFDQQVAVKLLAEEVAGAALAGRSRNEVKIQAELGGHPNIAALLDAGATDAGRPYLVMEYVDGRRIDDHCDALRLNIEARLRLFLIVCDAVSFAHRHAIIHRDLKPSNIMVTLQGVPKLIDFGIAKLLESGPGEDGRATPTATAARLLTPEYASPEHVRGEALTTSSDVYSLGVVLYELLTGRRPYRVTGRSLLEIERLVSTREPERPSVAVTREEGEDTPKSAVVAAARSGPLSKIRRQLAGDLDTIVLMALRREPARRYPTVDQFADDLRRYLDGRPVQARPDSVLYRARKFAGRNRLLVVTAGLLLLALVGGIAGTSAGLVLANRQRARAEKNLEEARSNLALARRAVGEAFTRISEEKLSTPASSAPAEGPAGGRTAFLWGSRRAQQATIRRHRPTSRRPSIGWPTSRRGWGRPMRRSSWLVRALISPRDWSTNNRRTSGISGSRPAVKCWSPICLAGWVRESRRWMPCCGPGVCSNHSRQGARPPTPSCGTWSRRTSGLAWSATCAAISPAPSRITIKLLP